MISILGEFRGRIPLVVASVLGMTAGMTATMFYSLGAFIPPLQAEFGWSRGDISLGVTCMTFAMFVTGTFAGRLADRFGAARIGALSLVAFAISVIVMVQTVTQISQFWFGYAVIAVLGIGSTPIVLLRPITTAFDRQRGFALGIALTGAGVAGFWVPRLVTLVTEIHGWRAAYVAIAAIALLTAPLVWFGLRVVARESASSAAIPVHEAGIELAAARRMPQYWLLTAMALALGLSIAGIVVHLIALFRDLGAAPLVAAGIASTVGLASVVGRLVVGLFLDRFTVTRVALAVLGFATLGLFLLWSSGMHYAYVAAALLGLAAGAENDLLAYAVARYFGQINYGAIFGWLYGVFALGYGISPYVVGRLRDHFGNYDVALGVSAALMIVAGLTSTRLGPYRYASE